MEFRVTLEVIAWDERSARRIAKRMITEDPERWAKVESMSTNHPELPDGSYYLEIGPFEDGQDGFTDEDRKEMLEDAGWQNVSIVRDQPVRQIWSELERQFGFGGQLRMHFCPICGNKRCPKADSERYKCTGSNEVNQIGELEAADEASETRVAE
jgi:hypothetical protein